MADTKITDLTALGAAPATNDQLLVVDVSDSTMAASGTDKKFTVANLFTSPTITTPVISSQSSASGAVWAASTTAAAQTASTTAGVGLTITADPAVAGSTNAGAAAGGAVTITSGNAARLTSGNADGGHINLTTGTGIGSGVLGSITITNPSTGSLNQPAIRLGATGNGISKLATNSVDILVSGGAVATFPFSSGINLGSAGAYRWSSTSASTGTADTFISRRGAASPQFGDTDAAAPVAQTIAFQGARAGTDTNTAAVDATFQTSLGTGTGATGSFIFNVGVKAASGTSTHTTAQALKLNYDSTNATAQITAPNGVVAAPGIVFVNGTGTGFFSRTNTAIDVSCGGNGICEWVNNKYVGTSGHSVGWSNSTSVGSNPDIMLSRVAAGIMEVNNGTGGTQAEVRLSGISGNNTVKALTESSATTFVTITVPSNTSASGRIIYSIEANDASNYQNRSGVLHYSAVNKAGTTTIALFRESGSTTVDNTTDGAAVSSGTLTNTFTATDGGSGAVQIKANAVSSLTQTTLQIRYRVEQLGTNTVTPA